jgi:phosphotriesterase-related protein
MHEHVLCDIRPPGTRSDNDLGPEITLENVWQINYGRGIKRAGRKYMLDLEDIATREVAMMKHEGGDAIVELSCGGLSPDPNGLRRIAAATGVHLIMGCGYYVERLPGSEEPRPHGRRFRRRDDRPDPRRRLGHRRVAGMIGEIGCQSPWTDTEKRVMQAAFIAAEGDRRLDQRPSRPRRRPAAGGRRLRQGGRFPDRAHRDQPHRPHDLRRPAAEARRLRRDGGVRPVRPGIELLRPQRHRHAERRDAAKLIRALIDHGHLDRVVISHDICYRTRLASFGGHGYGHIFRNVVPMMKKRGYSEDEIDAILVDNPRRLLTFV